jgi:hypothetical protein
MQKPRPNIKVVVSTPFDDESDSDACITPSEMSFLDTPKEEPMTMQMTSALQKQMIENKELIQRLLKIKERTVQTIQQIPIRSSKSPIQSPIPPPPRPMQQKFTFVSTRNLPHPFIVNGTPNLTFEDNIRNQIKHEKMREITELVVSSGLARVFGGFLRDDMLEPSQTLMCRDICEISTSEAIPPSASVTANDLDCALVDEFSNHIYGLTAGHEAANELHKLLVENYGKKNITPLIAYSAYDYNYSNGKYSDKWLWRCKYIIVDGVQFHIDIVAQKSVAELQELYLSEDRDQSEIIHSGWDLSVNCLQLTDKGIVLSPEYIRTMQKNTTLSRSIEVHDIISEIERKTARINHFRAQIPDIVLARRVSKLLVRGWVCELDGFHIRFDPETSEIVVFRSSDVVMTNTLIISYKRLQFSIKIVDRHIHENGLIECDKQELMLFADLLCTLATTKNNK